MNHVVLPQDPCGSASQNLLLEKEWTPTCLTQLAAPEKPETDILLPFLVQCWVGRTQHRGDSSSPSRAWPVWEAGVGNHLFTQDSSTNRLHIFGVIYKISISF